MAMLDILGSIEITASAAVIVTTTVLAYPGGPATRWRLAFGFVAWAILVAALAGYEAFHPDKGIGTIGLGLAFALPLLAMVLLARGSAERFSAVLSMPLTVIIAVHWVRVFGINFLLLQDAGRLPAPFAPTAGWGDILVGLAALPVAWAIKTEMAGWRPLAVIFSAFGALDLVTAVTLGVLSAPDLPIRLFTGGPDTTMMITLPWMLIPAFIVPILLMLHVTALVQLARLPAGSNPLGTPARA
jgi:hypothetical protein